MEKEEVEMTEEELQKFIWDNVNLRLLRTPEIMNKQSQLLLLWDRKEKLYTDLFKLVESVSKCEITVRQLYAKLGWVYEELNTGDCNGSASYSGGEETDPLRCSPASSSAACLKEEQEEIRCEFKSENPEPRKELRVLLTRLPADLRTMTPVRLKVQPTFTDDELSNTDSEYHPSSPSSYSDSDSDSDFSLSSERSGKHKKKKLRKTETFAKETPVQRVTPFHQQPSTVKPAPNVQQVNVKSQDTANNVDTPSANRNNTLNSTTSGTTQVKKDIKQHAATVAVKPASSSANVLPEVCVGMTVFARRKRTLWESGTVANITEKEGGTKKYKVTFEDKGKVLVSGHHIAHSTVPKLQHLYLGARVASKIDPGNAFFSPGILAELPSRKNHMRFLVFFDDHLALYVALPAIRLICKALPDPLDDIRDEIHKNFMREYLQRMPYPPQTQFRLGQSIKVELDGVLEACTVVQIDSSLMEVVFAKDEHKEWIYRGSMRLEHIINAKETAPIK